MTTASQIWTTALAIIAISCLFGFAFMFVTLNTLSGILRETIASRLTFRIRLSIASLSAVFFSFLGLILSLVLSQTVADQLARLWPSLASSNTPSATATATSSYSPTPAAVTPTPLGRIFGLHRVMPGEDLLCIAKAYGIDPLALSQANDYKVSVSPGEVLRLPAKSGFVATSIPSCQRQLASPFITEQPTQTSAFDGGTPTK